MRFVILRSLLIVATPYKLEMTRQNFLVSFLRQATRQRALCYGVASVSRIDKIIGLFCKRAL